MIYIDALGRLALAADSIFLFAQSGGAPSLAPQ
jgi:hypothetical protein